jgi:predicted site-specific integrase-resolvase
MKKPTKPAPVIDLARKHAVIYARVSSKEQEKEGFSIPAQLKLLKEYAAARRDRTYLEPTPISMSGRRKTLIQLQRLR